jgi:A/G-specific adenine glycosylase
VTDAERLVEWFRGVARPLPWRTRPRDPYRSLVAELMAQQTQLERVVPRFVEFIRRFPDLAALASAAEEEVVEAWSGLGYYRRARQLHRLALEVEASGGELPRTAAGLERLPGIGPYTAAAIASMVHGEPAPAVDGNIARVAARVLARADGARGANGRAAALAWVRGLLDGAPPGEVNEALMELGATVCRPAAPVCPACPLAGSCRARAAGDPTVFTPPRGVRETVELRWLAAIAVGSDGRWLLRRVDEGPILRGLWLPPLAEADAARRLAGQALELLPIEAAGPVSVLDPVRHSITYRRIEVVPGVLRGLDPVDPPAGWLWADPRSPGLPTSSLLGKLRRAVER